SVRPGSWRSSSKCNRAYPLSPCPLHKGEEIEGHHMTFLVVQGVSMYFRGLAALQDVHMAMEAGEIRGVIGPNGAGKSTLINTISRFYTPSRGSIWLEGVNLVRLPAHAVTRQGVARTFQNLELFPAMTVLDNVLV